MKEKIVLISEVICGIITICLVLTASSAQEKTFTQFKEDSKVVMASQSSTVHSSSFVDCALLCTQLISPCRSFVYNKTTGQCTAGSWIYPSENVTGVPLGDWYVQPGFVCDGSNGFTSRPWSKSPNTCLRLSDFKANNADAKLRCQASGGQLFVTEPLYKQFLMTYRVLNTFINESFWLSNQYANAGTRCGYLSIASDKAVWANCFGSDKNSLFRFVCELN